jgi:hypothetical protein
MVVILHRGIVDHTHISRGTSHTTADAQKEQSTNHCPQEGDGESLQEKMAHIAERNCAMYTRIRVASA